MKKRVLIRISVAVAILAAANLPSLAQEADATLNAFFQSYLDAHFRQQPLAATGLGDHRFDGLLDDLSRAARDGWVALDRQQLASLPHEEDYTKLSTPTQVDFELY